MDKRKEYELIIFKWYLQHYPKVYIECDSLLSTFKNNIKHDQ